MIWGCLGTPGSSESLFSCSQLACTPTPRGLAGVEHTAQPWQQELMHLGLHVSPLQLLLAARWQEPQLRTVIFNGTERGIVHVCNKSIKPERSKCTSAYLLSSTEIHAITRRRSTMSWTLLPSLGDGCLGRPRAPSATAAAREPRIPSCITSMRPAGICTIARVEKKTTVSRLHQSWLAVLSHWDHCVPIDLCRIVLDCSNLGCSIDRRDSLSAQSSTGIQDLRINLIGLFSRQSYVLR